MRLGGLELRRVRKASGIPELSSLPRGASTTDLTPMARMLSQTQPGNPYDLDDQGRPVQFGPGQPAADTPLGGDPRQFQVRPGWNLPTLPGEGKLTSWDTLKAIPRVYEIAGKAIKLRADEIANLHIDLIARDRDVRRSRQVLNSQQQLIERIKDFFAYPDRRSPWAQWIRRLIREKLTTDAVSLFVQRNLDPSGGPEDWGNPGTRKGEAIALLHVDGSTLKPLFDFDSRVPLPPKPAYQQFLWGAPRMTFTSQDLIYAPENVTVDTPYGFSETEQALMHINLALKFWQSELARYTDGTLPEGVAEAPPEWTVEQLVRFNDEWDKRLAGDPRALRKMSFVPHGFTWHDFKGDNFNETLARYILDVTCVCYDVTPTELGMEPSHGGLGGKGLGETMTDVSERRSVRPTVRWLFDQILNPFIWSEFDATDLEWSAIELEAQSEQDHAKAQDMNLRNGRISLDEIIEEDGGTPIGVGRLFVVGNSVLGEPDLKRISTIGALPGGYLPTELGANAPTVGPDGTPQPAAQAAPGAGEGDTRETGVGGNDPGATVSGRGEDLNAKTKAADAEVLRWQRKAVNALKAGRSPAVRFESDALPMDAILTFFPTRLAACAHPDQVRAEFAHLRAALAAVDAREVAA